MNKSNHPTEAKQAKKPRQKQEPALQEEELGQSSLPAHLSSQAIFDRTLESQANLLTNSDLPSVQRQAIVSKIGQVQGNHHLQRVVAKINQNAGRQKPESDRLRLNNAIQREFAVEPTTPNRRVRTLSQAEIQAAITFNQGKHTDAREIALVRDILGINETPADIDEDFVQAVVRYQAQYGETQDGKIGGKTAERLAREIIASADFLGPGNLGDLGPEFQLKTSLETLVSASNRIYADYKSAIQAATMIQGQIVLQDESFLRSLKALLSWNDFARSVELLGRLAPSYNDLINDRTVLAALNAAWTASNPAVPAAGTTQHEEGGWVYLNLITGNLTTRSAPVGAGASINLSSPPTVTDSVVVGMFHTHPNLGPGWTPGPSGTDLTLDAADGVPDVVVGTPGVDPAVFQFFPSGPDRRLHLAGNRGLPGASGGLSPQAKSDDSFDER
jgi:hypothetical protein